MAPDDHLDHGIGDLLLQEQQPQRGAALPRAHESGGHDIVDDLLRQRGGVDEHGVQAARLGNQRYDGAVARGQAAVDGECGRCRSGHRDTGERGMRERNLTEHAAGRGNEVQRPRARRRPRATA